MTAPLPDWAKRVDVALVIQKLALDPDQADALADMIAGSEDMMNWQNDLRSAIDHCTNWHEHGDPYDAIVESVVSRHEALVAAAAAYVIAHRDLEAADADTPSEPNLWGAERERFDDLVDALAAVRGE